MDNTDLSRLRIQRNGGAHKPRASRWLWVGLCVALAAGVGGWWRYGYEPAVDVEAANAVTAYPSQGYTLLNATGYVVAQKKAAVASKATGRLEWLGVREGASVRQGEVIARLENRDVSAQREQAEANVRLARANLQQGEAELKEAQAAFRRSRDLLDQGFVSAAAHDTVLARRDKAQAALAGLQAAIAVAEANLKNAQVALDQTLIRAPFDGVVLTKNANVGDVITPFSSALDTKGAVVTMADMSTLEVEADVSESNLAKVALEQPCEIQLDALPGVRLAGVVSRTVPTVDRAKATVMTKIRFLAADSRVLPDMSAKVAFLSKPVPEAEKSPRVAVPASALVERDGARAVFALREGRAQLQAVKTGMRIGDLIEIADGLKSGDKVVLRPAPGLKSGARVALPAK